MDFLSVKVRPVRTEDEKAAIDSALETLVRLAYRDAAAEWEYREAVERGFRSKNSTAEVMEQERAGKKPEKGRAGTLMSSSVRVQE